MQPAVNHGETGQQPAKALADAAIGMPAQPQQAHAQRHMQGDEQALGQPRFKLAQAVQQTPFGLGHGVQFMTGQGAQAQSPEYFFHRSNPELEERPG